MKIKTFEEFNEASKPRKYIDDEALNKQVDEYIRRYGADSKEVEKMRAALDAYKAKKDEFHDLCEGPSGGWSQWKREEAGFAMTDLEDELKAIIGDWKKK
jgi:predicted metal-dependent hydrolase